MTSQKAPRYIGIGGPIGVGKTSLAKILAQQFGARVIQEEAGISLSEMVYKLLVPTVPRPDLLIYLQARPEVLLARIRKRGVEYERNISLDYLRLLSDAYNEYFFHS